MKRLILLVVGSWLLIGTTAAMGADGTRAGSSDEAAQVQVLQGRIAENPDLMGLVMSLQNDPDMQALLKDQKVLDAVESGDYSVLMKDPRIRQLLQNPRVKELGRRLQDQSTGEKGAE